MRLEMEKWLVDISQVIFPRRPLLKISQLLVISYFYNAISTPIWLFQTLVPATRWNLIL